MLHGSLATHDPLEAAERLVAQARNWRCGQHTRAMAAHDLERAHRFDGRLLTRDEPGRPSALAGLDTIDAIALRYGIPPSPVRDPVPRRRSGQSAGEASHLRHAAVDEQLHAGHETGGVAGCPGRNQSNILPLNNFHSDDGSFGPAARLFDRDCVWVGLYARSGRPVRQLKLALIIGRDGRLSDIRGQITELFCTAAELHGYTARVTADGEVTVTGPAGTAVYYLENLVREIAAAPPQDWAALVSDHLTTGLSHDEVSATEPLEAMEFAAVQALVRTRLYPDSARDQVACVCRSLAPGLTQRVVLDGVHTISPVTYQLLARWGVDEGDLFALGEQNTRTDGPLDVERADFPEGAPPWFLLKGNDYTSAHALWLGDYPDVIGRAGALFTVPAELSIYAAPIDGIDVLEAGEILASLAVHHFANDPWPTSPHLYRWHGGHIELVTYVQPTDESLELHPTHEFLTLLNQLA
ncbi:hypothetical protein [Nocardia sp. NPDC004123]